MATDKSFTLPRDQATELFEDSELIFDEVVSTHRWYAERRAVIQHADQFVEVTYYSAASELQEQDLWMDAPTVTFRKVKPVTVSTTKWEVV